MKSDQQNNQNKQDDHNDVKQRAVELHRKHNGKIRTQLAFEIEDADDLSLAYTPGVGAVSSVIAEDEAESFELTARGRTVAVVSDGSAVLGLGSIGPAAGHAVMEGKAALLKSFADVDAVPLSIATQDSDEIVRFVEQIEPSFAGVNLEDISAPRCFEIEERLQQSLNIPIFHDDQHGTAIVVSAALHNAAQVVGKDYSDLRVVVIGAGAAGIAVSKLLLGIDGALGSYEQTGDEQVGDLLLVDSRCIVHDGRDDLNPYKAAIAERSNRDGREGDLAAAMEGADVVIGVSRPGLIEQSMVESMADDAIVFALANPTPEIFPDEAAAAGATVVATGRSDFANQINNVLAFPGIFKAVVDGKLRRITTPMKQAAARALAAEVSDPTAAAIIPHPFKDGIAERLSAAVLEAADDDDFRS